VLLAGAAQPVRSRSLKKPHQLTIAARAEHRRE
jgi:hypothetical protein